MPQWPPMISTRQSLYPWAFLAAARFSFSFRTFCVLIFSFNAGKTSVSVALAHIFGFGHIQNDDVYSTKPLPLARDVYHLLHEHDVVIADKCVISLQSQFLLNYSYDSNNHLKVNRQYLRDEGSKFLQTVRLLALNWSFDQPPAAIHRICSDRIQQRIDNNPTLPADSSSHSHEDVTWLFINTAQELTPDEVDNVVEMKVGESMEESVKRAIEGCVSVMGLEMPSDAKIQEGLEIAKNYVPPVKIPEEKKSVVRCYGLLPMVNLEELLDRAFANEDQSNKHFWTQLKTDRRISKRPHIKTIHRCDRDTESDLWNRCVALHKMSTAIPPLFKGTLSNVIWNGRVMAITVDDIDVASTSSESNEGREFVSNFPHEARSRLHIVVGTKHEGIRPLEAKVMVQNWRRGEELDKIKSIKLVDLSVFGRIKPLWG